jgi:ArsR family transcriptional regulator
MSNQTIVEFYFDVCQDRRMSKQSVLSPAAATGPAACCVRGPSPLTTGEATSVAPMFKALGDPVRLRMLSIIASAESTCVCDLTALFDLTGPTISHHLRVLREAGLIDSERRGTWVHLRVRAEALDRLSALLLVPVAT